MVVVDDVVAVGGADDDELELPKGPVLLRAVWYCNHLCRVVVPPDETLDEAATAAVANADEVF